MKTNYKYLSALLLSIGLATSANADVIIEGIGSISKIRKANILAVTNSYTGLTNMGAALTGAAKDAALLRNIHKAVVFEDADTSKIDTLLSLFASSDCQNRKESRIVWLSGHGYSYSLSPNSRSMYRYSFIGNQQYDEKTKSGAYDINSLLVKLASSDCKYVIGIDAEPPTFVQDLPRNVTVVWAAGLGGHTKDTPDGGVLTLAFNKAYTASKIWTANTLTAFLRANTPELTGLFSKPWVQSDSPDDTIYFPSEDTSSPVVRVGQKPQFHNDDGNKSSLDGVKFNEKITNILKDTLRDAFKDAPR